MEEIKRVNRKDIIIFLIAFISFSFYLYIYNPGLLTFDSYYQISQIHTFHFTNWHPFFHTFIEMLCMKIYDSPISVCIFQILVFSIMWTIICKYIRRNNDNRKLFIIQIIFTFIITAIIPINAIYAITLWKDILFSYCLMFLTFLIYVVINEKYEVSNKRMILLSLIMAFIWNLRPNGSYTIILFLIIFGIVLFRKNRKSYMFIKIPVITIALSMLIMLLNPIFKVEDNAKDALAAKVSHALAYYTIKVDIEKKDIETISKLINIEKLEENFNIYFLDPNYAITNIYEFKENKSTYIKLYLKYSIKNPVSAIKYIAGSSILTWDVFGNNKGMGSVYNTNIENSYGTEIYNQKNKNKKIFKVVDKYVNDFNYNKVTNTLFMSPALYMYLSIVLLIIMFLKNYKLLLIYIPNALNILIVAASIPIQDTRYLYPNILIFYLIIMIFIYKYNNINHKNEKI